MEPYCYSSLLSHCPMLVIYLTMLSVAKIIQCPVNDYVGVLISLCLFLFPIFPICSTTKRIFLGWVKEVRTRKS
jgi:hypothetical protein